MVERWLHLMEESLDECDGDISEDHRQYLLDYMRYQAYYIVVWGETYRELIHKGGTF